jgi:hypothetical protein
MTMTRSMSHCIRTLSVAALLAVAVLSLPAGAAHAAGTSCGHPLGVPTVGSPDNYRPGDKAYYKNKTHICDDNGSWIIITDEVVASPETQPQAPRVTQVAVAPPSGGVLAQP